MNQQVKIKSRAKNIFPQVAALVSFANRRFHNVQHIAIFAADIDVSVMRIDGTARDGDAFDQLVRVHFHQRAVFTSPRLRLVGVTDYVFGLRRILRHERPLQASREACSAAAAQAGFLDLVNNRFRGHLLQRFIQRLVRPELQRHVNLVGILDAPALTDQRRFLLRALVQRPADDPLRLRPPAFVEILDQPI